MTKSNAGEIFIVAVCVYMASLNQRVRTCVGQQQMPLMTATDRQRLFRDIQTTSVSSDFKSNPETLRNLGSLGQGVTETTGIG